jgi:hypothetical protein
MSKNLLINGSIYNGVESISIPDAGGANAVFLDTSGATATPEMVLKGFTFGAGGVMQEGTLEQSGGAEVKTGIITPSSPGKTITIPDIIGCEHLILVMADRTQENFSATTTVLQTVSTLDGFTDEWGLEYDVTANYTQYDSASGNLLYKRAPAIVNFSTGTITFNAGIFVPVISYRYIAW